jgi:hypothetical protein
MKIYLISQNENNGYDTYDYGVVIADNEEEARNMSPAGYNEWKTKDNTHCRWCSSPNKVTVEYIGEADSKQEKGFVLKSFKTG